MDNEIMTITTINDAGIFFGIALSMLIQDSIESV
jgi:hypothetical protein